MQRSALIHETGVLHRPAEDASGEGSELGEHAARWWKGTTTTGTSYGAPRALRRTAVEASTGRTRAELERGKAGGACERARTWMVLRTLAELHLLAEALARLERNPHQRRDRAVLRGPGDNSGRRARIRWRKVGSRCVCLIVVFIWVIGRRGGGGGRRGQSLGGRGGGRRTRPAPAQSCVRLWRLAALAPRASLLIFW